MEERLDKYISVTTPKVWIALIIMLSMMIGVLVWSTQTELELNRGGQMRVVVPITYVTN